MNERELKGTNMNRSCLMGMLDYKELTIEPEFERVDLEQLPEVLIERAGRAIQGHILATGRLSRFTQKKMALAAKGKKPRKRYTFRSGTRHHNRLKATARRLYAKRWAKEPLACITNGWGCYRIKKEEWARLIQPIWDRLLPADLKVKRVQWGGAGTRAKPYTIYDLQVIHATLGIVYDGQSQLLYDLSCPVSEGANEPERRQA